MDNGRRWWVCVFLVLFFFPLFFFLTENDEVEQAVLSKKIFKLSFTCVAAWQCVLFVFARGIYLKAAHPVTLGSGRTERCYHIDPLGYLRRFSGRN